MQRRRLKIATLLQLLWWPQLDWQFRIQRAPLCRPLLCLAALCAPIDNACTREQMRGRGLMTDPNAVDETRPRLTWEHDGGTVLKPRCRPHAFAALQ